MATYFASGQVFSGVYASNAAVAANRTITGLNWTSGTATWSIPTPNPIWAGPTVADPVNERVTIQARRPIFIEEQEILPSIARQKMVTILEEVSANTFGGYMKIFLIVLTALYFGTTFSFANAAVDRATKTALTTACKGKASGTQVTINGKKYTCL